MLLGNICRTEEITKIQMREMNSEKELGGILRNQKWKILQKMKDDPIKDRKKDNKKGFTQHIKGGNVSFVEQFRSQENSHMILTSLKKGKMVNERKYMKQEPRKKVHELRKYIKHPKNLLIIS